LGLRALPEGEGEEYGPGAAAGGENRLWLLKLWWRWE